MSRLIYKKIIFFLLIVLCCASFNKTILAVDLFQDYDIQEREQRLFPETIIVSNPNTTEPNDTLTLTKTLIKNADGKNESFYVDSANPSTLYKIEDRVDANKDRVYEIASSRTRDAPSTIARDYVTTKESKKTNVSFAGDDPALKSNLSSKDIYTLVDGTTNQYTSNNTKIIPGTIFTIDENDEITSFRRPGIDAEPIKVGTIASLAQQQDNFDPVINCKISGNLLCYGASLTYYGILIPSANLLILSGSIFNFVVEQTIVNLKDNIFPDIKPADNETEAGVFAPKNTIDVGWGVLRDIANIFFIFALLYTAIRTIIGGTSDTGSTIATIIVVAVLINFSLFFTKVIIDISNTLSVSFYNSIVERNARAALGATQNISYRDLSSRENAGIAEPFILKTGISTIFTADKPNVGHKENSITYYSIMFQSIGGGVLLIILAVILFLMSFMLVSRMIILVFVLITSSLAFGSYMLPFFKSKIADRWWPALIGQAFFAPVFLLFLYLTLVFIDSLPFPTTNGFSSMADIQPSQIISYLIVVGMLFASMRVAKMISNHAGGEADTITGAISGAVLGTVGFGLRHSAGWIGNKAANIKHDDNRFTRPFTNILRAAGERVGSSSFDLRNSDTFNKVREWSEGPEAGKAGGEGGYKKYSEDKEKAEKEKISEYEKGYKDAGKATSQEQLTISINEKRKALIKNENKLSLEYKNKVSSIDQLLTDRKINPTEHAERIKQLNNSDLIDLEKVRKDLKDHIAKHGSVDKLEKEADKITTRIREAQQKYIKGLRGKAAEEFKTQEAIKKEKEKNPNEELINAIKAQSSGKGK